MAEVILAIDPGPTESGYALIEADTRRPEQVGKLPNDRVLAVINSVPPYDHLAIEMIASYGMAVGKEVFETCVWIGRFVEADERSEWPTTRGLVYRRDVKLHHCGSAKAKDANITQALIDRFAPGVRNRGKGTKAAPGFFHGFAGDAWQAFALAVYVADEDEHKAKMAALADGAA